VGQARQGRRAKGKRKTLYSCRVHPGEEALKNPARRTGLNTKRTPPQVGGLTGIDATKDVAVFIRNNGGAYK